MEPIDMQLFRRARRGDREAFWRLVLPFRGLIYSVAAGMSHDPEQAQEAVHDALLKAFQGLPDLRDPQKLPSWLYGITRNLMNERVRREQRQRRAMAGLARQPAPVVAVSEIREREAWLERMEGEIRRLPEPFRIVVGLKYLNESSCREIAEILGLSVPAVKSRLFEARKLLRERMEESEVDGKESKHEMP
ncbi:sigma-70 family RNA polymerase sigma factor [bacterium]|nr:sigma-70 family RNA polymerase sigma factor [bacterium]